MLIYQPLNLKIAREKYLVLGTRWTTQKTKLIFQNTFERNILKIKLLSLSQSLVKPRPYNQNITR